MGEETGLVIAGTTYSAKRCQGKITNQRIQQEWEWGHDGF